MKSTKGLVLLAVLLVGISVVAFTKNNKNVTDNPKQKLLTTVVDLIEKQHYAPQTIDDNFSKKIFNKYFDELDGDRILFTEGDINSLKKYETTLDNEMHGDGFDFIPALNVIYNKRTDEVIAQQKEILSKAFNFTVDETYIVDADKLPFAKTEAEKKDRLRKKLKLMTLDRFIDLQKERDSSVIDSIKRKTDTELEVEARAKVQKAIDKIYNRIKTKFTDDERFNSYVNLITTQMDPHTDYFAPVEKRAFDEDMSRRFYGIGAQLQETDGNIKIAALMPSYPAQRCGEIVVGDIIVKVSQADGEPVEITGYDISDAVKLIRGKKDSQVKLTMKKQDGTTKVVTLTRAEIVQDEGYARSAVVEEANGDKIGYIYLPEFYADFYNANGARCSEDVANEVIKLKAAGVKGITIDLRFNGGGSLQEVINMVGLFIPSGPVVQVRDKSGRATPLDDNDTRVLYDGPLVVMVNELSASASEIFAAAIQDYGRGIIVGSSSTYGKGTVQRQINLNNTFSFTNSTVNDMGSVKLTFQKFYRVSGGSTQLKGVTPDVVFPDVLDYLKIREKDNASALAWDNIAKANYTPYNKLAINCADIIKKENEAVAENATFKLIKNNTVWLNKKQDEPRSLEINKYKAYQKDVAATVAQNNNVLKAKTELKVDVTKEDTDKFYNNPDKAKGDRYVAWLKNLKTDLYLSETINVIELMINNSLTKTSSAN